MVDVAYPILSGVDWSSDWSLIIGKIKRLTTTPAPKEYYQAQMHSVTVKNYHRIHFLRKIAMAQLRIQTAVNNHAYQTKHGTCCFRKECRACNQIVWVVILKRARTSTV